MREFRQDREIWRVQALPIGPKANAGKPFLWLSAHRGGGMGPKANIRIARIRLTGLVRLRLIA